MKQRMQEQIRNFEQRSIVVYEDEEYENHSKLDQDITVVDVFVFNIVQW
jgi:hypothetical protein